MGETSVGSGALDESRLREERDTLRQVVRRLEATTEIARAVGGETDLDRILETIVKRGRALIDARSLLILLEDRAELRVAATAGGIDRDTEARIPIAGSAPGRVLRNHRPERLPSIGADLLAGPSSSEAGVAALLVPLTFHGHPLGVLVALDALGRDGGFTEEDERVLDSFAASAATAVATAQSVAEHRLRDSIEAAERERGRWARELHDEALQSMGGLRLMLSSARRGGGGETDRLLSRALEQVDTAIAEMRRLIADLRPAALDELGLAPALEALAERLAWSDVLHAELRLDLGYDAGRHPTRLTRQIEDTVYRLAQEALNNAARHAEGGRTTVEVVEAGETIRVRIEDEGRGFDPTAETGGFGLLGMRERVTLAGGTLNVESAPGEGTTVTAVLPARHRDFDGEAEGGTESGEAGRTAAGG